MVRVVSLDLDVAVRILILQFVTFICIGDVGCMLIILAVGDNPSTYKSNLRCTI